MGDAAAFASLLDARMSAVLRSFVSAVDPTASIPIARRNCDSKNWYAVPFWVLLLRG